MLRYPNSKRSMSLEDIIALLADPLRGVRLQELENKETGIKTIVFSGTFIFFLFFLPIVHLICLRR